MKIFDHMFKNFYFNDFKEFKGFFNTFKSFLLIKPWKFKVRFTQKDIEKLFKKHSLKFDP